MQRLVATLTALVMVALTTTVSTTARAAKRRTEFPCAACITDLPDPPVATKAPVLVLLHGDGQGPLAVAPLFAKEAAARGLVLFVPKCPKADGCKDARWWAWGKDPGWFDAQLDAIDAVQPIDRERLWLVGWSGGGSYIGEVAPALFGRFAAVVIVGGGMPPSVQTCPQTCALPAYFLVGDKNPLHALAKDLRAWFDGCAQDVTWDLLPGKDHAGEHAEISKASKAATIVDWLEARPKKCAAIGPKPEPVTEPVTEPGPDPVPETGTETEAGTATETAVPKLAPPMPGPCGCRHVGTRDGDSAWLVAIALGALRAARRR